MLEQKDGGEVREVYPDDLSKDEVDFMNGSQEENKNNFT